MNSVVVVSKPKLPSTSRVREIPLVQVRTLSASTRSLAQSAMAAAARAYASLSYLDHYSDPRGTLFNRNA
jgi:hypothetical protein